LAVKNKLGGLYASRVPEFSERPELLQRLDKMGARVRERLQPPAALAFGMVNQVLEPGTRRAGFYTKTPTAPEILANCSRGWMLFGLSFPGLHGLEWHHFPLRTVITRESARVPKEFVGTKKRGKFEVRFDEDFESVMERSRAGRSGWLSDEAVAAYRSVHELGFCATVGTYRDGRLVGGMWGISVGRTFGIMSMFHSENSAGSVAVAAVAERVIAGDRWSLVDCGLRIDTFGRFGAREMTTEEFCELMWRAMPPAG
jgi:leucyl/phenylalanyl-tRNA---protein transferase